MLDEIVRFTRDRHRFAVTSHARPDGDSIGSELGLGLALEALGKTVTIVNADRVPRIYRWLPGAERVRIVDRLEGSWDAVYVLECNDLNRPGVRNLDRYPVVNIDHHARTEPFGTFNWVDSGAAAVAEMVYRLLLELEVPVTPEIATNLYVAIMTDTGSFRFSSTHAGTFHTAARLTEAGADPGWIAQQVYMNQPRSRVGLLVKVLDTLEIHPSGRIASIYLSQSMLSEAGATAADAEGLVNFALGLEGIQMAALVRQDKHGQVRVSLRSKGDYDVGLVASGLGGGGHRNAAGLRMKGDSGRVSAEVLDCLEQLLDAVDQGSSAS